MICYFRHQPSGCYWLRIEHPMNLLSEHGLDVRALETEKDIHTDFYDKIKSIQVYGVYPFNMGNAIKKLKADGKRVIYDFDDAMEYVEKTSPFYDAVQRDKDTANDMFELADHITVATPALAEYARTKSKAPITVIPNCYKPEEWTYPRPKRAGLRIGFMGAAPHIVNLQKILPIIENLQARHDIRFLIMGFSKGKFQDWVNEYKAITPEEGKKAVDNFVEGLRNIKFEWIPFVDYRDFPSTLINLSLDIALCPLQDTPFNRCRSASKAMEYTLAGALALAENLPTYNQDKSSVLVDDWDKTLTYYVEHPYEIEPKRLEHLKWLQENRTMESQLDTLKKVYDI